MGYDITIKTSTDRDANAVVITGEIMDEPKTGITRKGTKVGELRILVREAMNNGGTYEENVKVVGWSSMADAVTQYKKGDRVCVVGKIHRGVFPATGQPDIHIIAYSIRTLEI